MKINKHNNPKTDKTQSLSKKIHSKIDILIQRDNQNKILLVVTPKLPNPRDFSVDSTMYLKHGIGWEGKNYNND